MVSAHSWSPHGPTERHRRPARAPPGINDDGGPHPLVGPAVVVHQDVSSRTFVTRTVVRVVSAAVFVDPADQTDECKTGCDVDDPEAYGQSEESAGRGQAKNQRPPAPGAEVTLFTGTLMDLRIAAVLGTHPDAFGGEGEVGTDHAGQASDQKERDVAYRLSPLRQEAVDNRYRDEEEDAESKKP